MTKPIDPTEHLKVVAGNPSAEELAVVVAVLQAAAASAASAESNAKPIAPVSSWHQNTNNLRGAINPGHGQWQASYRRGLN